ncbi:MAG: large conductance mechanosensitive channel protein MscL [Bacteroidia bacterium]|nr:large conductance mechanosensitive channel protein MscL [Bacteroidia bacterium]
MGFISEFKEFINKGNVVDLAVAVILGGAFQAIVTSMVDDIIMPVIALIGGFDQIEDLKAGPFTYGKFLAAVIKFLLIAIVLFTIIKVMNNAKSKKEAETK